MITASAPGSLMLLGEHAVLHGSPALVVALNCRLQVSLVLGGKGRSVVSEGYGEADLDSPHLPFQFAFVKAALTQAEKICGKCLDMPFTLHIISEFTDTLGFGSSAAVLIATLGAFWTLHHEKEQRTALPYQHLWIAAREGIQQVQGLGSGADAAASLLGGVVLCEPDLSRVTRVAETVPLIAVYSGVKRKTVEVVREMQERTHGLSEIMEALFKVSERLVRQGTEALQHGDHQQLGLLANMGHGLMEAYGVNNPVLQDLVQRLRAIEGIYGAKISGSGLGDCVIGIGTLASPALSLLKPYPVFPIQTADEGLLIETS